MGDRRNRLLIQLIRTNRQNEELIDELWGALKDHWHVVDGVAGLDEELPRELANNCIRKLILASLEPEAPCASIE